MSGSEIGKTFLTFLWFLDTPPVWRDLLKGHAWKDEHQLSNQNFGQVITVQEEIFQA